MYSSRIAQSEKSWEKLLALYCAGGWESIVLLEGSQASPPRPSDKDSVKVKTLESLDVVT
jgi:hypothetical protein